MGLQINKPIIAYIVSSEGISRDNKGGAGTHIRGTIAAFESQGFRVESFFSNRSEKNDVKETDVKSHVVASKRRRGKGRLLLRDINTFYKSIKFALALYNELKRYKKSEEVVIYERSCIFSISGLLLSKCLNIPLYLETSGCLVEIFSTDYGLFSEALANYLEKKKLQMANVVVTEAETAISYVRDKFSLSDSTIIAKPLGVEDNDVDEEACAILKDKYLLEDKIVVGYAGTFASYHKMEKMLPVFEAMRGTGVVFLLCGDGGNRSILENEVKTRGYGNVIFTGRIDKANINNYYRVMDYGIIPDSEKHMAPIKLYEYGINSMVPIVPDYLAYSHLVEGVNCVKFNDINDVKDKIASISKAEVLKMATSWRNQVIEGYTWDKTILKLRETFNENTSHKR